MNKTMVMVALLSIALLVLAGCGQTATGAVPRGSEVPYAPSGGGCGIAAPAADASSGIADAVSNAGGSEGL
jgi:hypothetical protein